MSIGKEGIGAAGELPLLLRTPARHRPLHGAHDSPRLEVVEVLADRHMGNVQRVGELLRALRAVALQGLDDGMAASV